MTPEERKKKNAPLRGDFAAYLQTCHVEHDTPGLFAAAAKLQRIELADELRPTDQEWRALVMWARKTARSLQYHASGIEAILELLNIRIGGYGTEAIFGHKERAAYPRFFLDVRAIYVNTGDTYSTTILYNTVTERFSVTSWGDFVERYEKRYGVS